MDNTKATFEGIKKDIIEYLSANPTFKDYNFTAPAITTLVDALAYTSHYLIRYANFSLNECFLDSAQLRNNVVSHAKELGYIPYQYRSSKAKLRLIIRKKDIINESGEYQFNEKILEDTIFLATDTVRNKTYTFRTVDQFMFEYDKEEDKWVADIEVVEGVYVTEKFKQDEYNTTKYILINNKVDTDYISVNVKRSETDNSPISYRKITDITDFGPDEHIYYLQETTDGKIEIYFGDNKISARPDPYSIILVKYLVTNGHEANDIINFTMSNPSEYGGKVEIVVLDPSSEGSDREDIESIRFNAPKFYQAQDRAVTTSDYNALILNKFGGWVDSIISWGGEDNIPPQYAYVFLCIKPKYTEVLSPSQRNQIIEYLSQKNMPCIDIVIQDPMYIDVNLSLSIDWWAYKTNKTKYQLYSLVENVVKEYFNVNINTFNSKLKYSTLLTKIAEIDPSIDSILSNFKLVQHISPERGIKTPYILYFHNKIEPESIIIGPWRYSNESGNYSIYDNGEGVLYLINSNNSYKKEVIGKVDYDSGIIELYGYEFKKNLIESFIDVSCTPVVENIKTAKNYILKLTDLNIDIHENI